MLKAFTIASGLKSTHFRLYAAVVCEYQKAEQLE